VEVALKDVLQLSGGRLLSGRLAGRVCGVSTDTRSLRRGELFVALKGERFDGHEFLARAFECGASGVVISGRRWLPQTVPEAVAVIDVADTLQALGRLAAGYRKRLVAKVIGITGSCGKTVLKEMLGQVLARHMKGTLAAASYNNQIGVPLTLLAADPEDRFVILEMGTNAPGEIGYLASIGRPDVGIVTVIAEAHLKGLGNLDSVAAEKAALVESLPAEGLAVLNADDPRVMRMAKRSRARVVTFGVGRDADYRAQRVEITPQGLRFRARGPAVAACRQAALAESAAIPIRLGVIARYYVPLAMATMAVAEHLGVEAEALAEDLRHFRPPPMRLTPEMFGDVLVINDAYNANYCSALAALEVLNLWPDRRKVIFFGDMVELGAESKRLHIAVGRRIAESGVERLVTVGAEAAQVSDAAVAAGLSDDAVRHFETSLDAARKVGSFVRSGDVVLVKGSRRMVMERIVDALRGAFV